MKQVWLGLALAMYSLAAVAGWQLDSEHSGIYFISTKNAQIAEVHTFKTIAGDITEHGKVEVSIDLASVDTSIDIRNQRLKNLLFETDRYSAAKITADVDLESVKALAMGEFSDMPVTAALDLHGVKHTFSAQLRVTKLSGERFKVSTLKPVVLVPSIFGLESGLKALRDVAKLLSIANSVPVTLDWVFTYHPD